MPQLILKAYCEGSSGLAQPLMANIDLDIQCFCYPVLNPDTSCDVASVARCQWVWHHCTFPGHEAWIHCSHHRCQFAARIQFLFRSLRRAMQDVSPHIKLRVNRINEPRLLRPLRSGQRNLYGNTLDDLTTMFYQLMWDAVTRHCPVPARNRCTKRRTR